MAQILTSVALYETLQKHGRSEEKAYRIVSGEMWKFLDPSGMQKLAKRRFFLPLMKKLVPFGFKKGSGFGWRYTWHEDIINYGNLPYTDFIRTETLCQGGKRCDFRFVRHRTDAGDGWRRSRSV